LVRNLENQLCGAEWRECGFGSLMDRRVVKEVNKVGEV
jgi:hypothetical protein